MQTQRLLLRPIVMEDAREVFAFSREQNVGPNAGWKPHASLRDTIEIMPKVLVGQQGVFGVVLKDTGILIGSIGLMPDVKRSNPRVRMLGYALSERCWGRGFTTEAARAVLHYGFETLHLDMISAYCYPQNERSQRVLAKCGFIYEGCLRQSELRYDGKTLDNLCYALTRERFMQKRG